MGFSTKRCLLVAPVSSASLFLPRLLPAKIAAVALSAVAMRADAEDGFTHIAASWTKQDLRHVLDDKPPLRFGDDAEGSLSNRRVIKKPRFLTRGDTQLILMRKGKAGTVVLEGPSGTLLLSIGGCVFVFEEPREAKPVVREEAESTTISALSVFFQSNEVFVFYELRDPSLKASIPGWSTI